MSALTTNRQAYGVGATAIAIGLAFPVAVAIRAPADLFIPLVSGAAFVFVGLWAVRRPSDLPRILGAAAGALSAPLYFPLVGFAHPNDVGMDFGRGFVGLALPVIVPLNMWIGATVGQRVAALGVGAANRKWAWTVGVGAVGVAALILWQAIAESSADPRVALWEIVHHGILPAAAIALAGSCMIALPAWLPTMCGALLGTFPAVLCSSLLVAPDPANYGQVPEALLAYSLPVTLPITVGVGALVGLRIDRRLRERGVGPRAPP